MARTSGPALPNLVEGSFKHTSSGVAYRVFRQGERALLSYERPGDSGLQGVQLLKYSVGSNTHGRTFLFEIDGFLYQAPMNYYAEKNVWDMSPGYRDLREMELNHPVPESCLFCHASRLQPTLAGTLNRYVGEAFLQGGVGCERCHGPGGDHVRAEGAMVDPAKLTGERRDGICMQCHLEGQASIMKYGRRHEDYRPGEKLSDYVSTFVFEDSARRGLGAVSQVESMALSVCKLKSGDKLACITCHDPHVQPNAQERAGYYRARCLGCHAPMAERHHPEREDCTACHMPRLESADIGHTQVTDHRIPRKANRDFPSPAPGGRLVQFGGVQTEDRELGLAYAEVALRGNELAGREALRLLEGVLPQYPEDPELLTRLGYLHQTRGDLDRAASLYERALERDPDQPVAASNLGVLYAQRGLLPKSLKLWARAFDKNPQFSEIGMNLGMGLCDAGDAKGAHEVLQRVVEHNPDRGAARRLLNEVAQGTQHPCGTR
jgi:Flp pilus assembly protein TadD